MGDTDSNLIKIGPIGNPSGDPWDEKGCYKIVCIFISHGKGGINSLQFQYEQDGALVLSKCHGTSSGLNFDMVQLDHPREYITGFAGIPHNKHLNSLVFFTKNKQTPTFGYPASYSTDGSWFRFNLGSGRLWGFFGSTDSEGVSSFGVYLKPIISLRVPIKNVLPKEVDSSMVKTARVGNTEGDPWDEKDFGKIVRIFISHSWGIINSLQFQYKQNGTLMLSKIHGHNAGKTFDVVELNHPVECVTKIHGRVKGRICSLIFKTNTKEYGPFGNPKEYVITEGFSFNLGEGSRIGGFFGTTDSDGICSLGVYLKPCSTLVVLPKEERP